MNIALEDLRRSFEAILSRFEHGQLRFQDAQVQFLLLQTNISTSDSQRLLRHYATRLNEASPISKLPDELLCLAFRELNLPAIALRTAIGGVCSRWRLAATSAPQLWNLLVLSRWGTLVSDLELLDWSGNIGLTVAVRLSKAPPPDFPFNEPSLALSRHVARFRMFSVRLAAVSVFRQLIGPLLDLSAPHLHTLNISVENLVSRGAISLRHFVALNVLKTSFVPRPGEDGRWLRGIRVLQLNSQVSATQLAAILGEAHGLKTLSILDLSVPSPRNPGVIVERGPVLDMFMCHNFETDWDELANRIPVLSSARIVHLRTNTGHYQPPSHLLLDSHVLSLYFEELRTTGTGQALVLVAVGIAKGKIRVFEAVKDVFLRWARAEMSANILRRIAVPARSWAQVHFLLGGYENSALRTVVLSVHPQAPGPTVSGIGAQFKPMISFHGPQPIAGQPLTIHAPAIEELLLVAPFDSASKSYSAIIYPSIALLYIQQLQLVHQLPLLRLVNIALVSGEETVLQADLTRNVGMIREEVSPDLPQQEWGAPSFAFEP
ncbi:hypothetical protein BKA62DRAFT_442977 [Auriculariales sp. MPI-PUGE-AT-0066]|nr:hypothetical protein BKA62DRAFT_442977 [Auriculariales sp. MPI-PUGE-AT-0066]